MSAEAPEKPRTLAEKRINRSPYNIYVRVVRIDTFEGIRFRFEITSNSTMSSNLSVLYSDEERAMIDFRHAVSMYSALAGAEHDSIG